MTINNSRAAAAAAIQQKLDAAGIQRPINWDELGSSEKDLWEERMLRSIDRSARRRGLQR